MQWLPLVLLTGCGVFGLQPLGSGSSSETAEPVDSGEPAPPVQGSLLDRTWESDLDAATINAPEGLDALLVLMDSSIVLLHVEREAGSVIDLVIALTGVDGHQDPCQPVLELSDADFSGNPWLAVDMNELPLKINGIEVVLRDVSYQMRIETYGEGFDQGRLQGELDGRELDVALGDRISSTSCELLAAMGTDCRACVDGTVACFDLDISAMSGVDYGGSFDASPDPSECD